MGRANKPACDLVRCLPFQPILGQQMQVLVSGHTGLFYACVSSASQVRAEGG